jgi:hypothetical protein
MSIRRYPGPTRTGYVEETSLPMESSTRKICKISQVDGTGAVKGLGERAVGVAMSEP